MQPWIRPCRSPTPQPTPYWLDDPGRPGRAARAHRRRALRPAGRRRRLHAGCGPRCSPRSATPAATSCSSRASEVGWAASGRNGGFCAASLTHGFANGLARWPGEFDTLERAGRAATSTRSRRRSPATASTATSSAPARSTWPPSRYQVDDLREPPSRRAGTASTSTSSTRDAVRARGRLADLPRRAVGPRAASPCSTPPSSPGASSGPACGSACGSTSTPAPPRSPAHGAGMAVRTPYGRVRARQVALGTNVFPSLVKRVRPYIVPVYDYALMTEPLTAEQLGVDRLGEPPGARRQRQPLPLLPAHRRQPHPVGRLRRDISLRRQNEFRPTRQANGTVNGQGDLR